MERKTLRIGCDIDSPHNVELFGKSFSIEGKFGCFISLPEVCEVLVRIGHIILCDRTDLLLGTLERHVLVVGTSTCQLESSSITIFTCILDIN